MAKSNLLDIVVLAAKSNRPENAAMAANSNHLDVACLEAKLKHLDIVAPAAKQPHYMLQLQWPNVAEAVKPNRLKLWLQQLSQTC